MDTPAHLTAGQGRCRVAASVSLKAAPSAVHLGAGDMALMGCLNALHHVNRHAPVDDFLAAALPGLHKTHAGLMPGHELVVFGSPERIDMLIGTEGVGRLVKRGALLQPEASTLDDVNGEGGMAFVRDRREERKTPGARARQARRAARRATHISETAGKHGRAGPARKADFTGLITLHYGDTPLFVRAVAGICASEIQVSTYGFSTAGEIAALPLSLDGMMSADAA